ncbi:MAG TPA: hypothetical protein VFN28_07890 [Amaricoccus sp.]|nr:hypothetical protein [Amaricoccus sp.]
MLVYGDRWRQAAPAMLLDDLARRLATAGDDVDRLTAALILAGELAQGVADAEAETLGEDDLTPGHAATLALAVAVAARLLAALGLPARAAAGPATALARVRALPLPPTIRCRTAESFAFYALYPETFAMAAAAADWPAADCPGPPLVIGIRSIGTSLAAAVAARLGCQALTVRPVSHPLRRELRLAAALRARLARHAGAFIVVDEGPGLSGSSFGSVGDALATLGVAEQRIVFMPSHANCLGPRAAPAHRARWERARRLPAVGGAEPATVAGWFADLAGADAQAEDLSGGRWRRDLPAALWPPAAPVSERLKIRLTGPRGRFLARFAGLGDVGEAKLDLARRLHAAGFAPEPIALRRGFLLERWIEGTMLPPVADPAYLAHLARYLGLRARALPADGDGAGPAELRRMAVVNAAELEGDSGDGGHGDALAERLDERLGGLERLSLVPVRIDGRLHRWEWRRTPEGAIVKTDALDHAAAHDLVGCQDIAWDIAGASVEMDLSDAAAEALRCAVAESAGRAIPAEAVACHRLCYAAFQAGLWRMTGEGGPDGAPRTATQIARYRAVLRRAAGLGAAPDTAVAAGAAVPTALVAR